MSQRPPSPEAVVLAFVGEERRRIELLGARTNGDIYYHGKLVGNDDDIATALIDIVNSHEKTIGGATEQALCWAITELIRRKNATRPEINFFTSTEKV